MACTFGWTEEKNNRMDIIMIAARSENGVIGKAGGLPWHMPADESFFLNEIEGCFLLSGRKSYESNQGNSIFQDKAYVIITRQKDYEPGPGGQVAHSVEAGIELARQKGVPRLCVLGGGEIYRQAIAYADQLILTTIHTHVGDGDAFFPDIDPDKWTLLQQEAHEGDADNPFPYTFKWYRRNHG